MVFSSVTFLFVFLPLLLAGLFLLPGKGRLFFLFLASLAFYAFGEPVAAALLLISAAEAFFAAKGMRRFPRAERWLFAASLVFHLGLLGLFKYAGFFCGILGLPAPRVALPAGISFYTFQNLAFLIDVRRGRHAPAKRFLPYAVYIAFFPQLIAGPIERWQDIEPQLERLPRLTLERLGRGGMLLAAGLGQKLLLADPMGQMWNALSADPSASGFLGCWAAALAYAFQIFFDFAGYSAMARGLGGMCGIALHENFRFPYAAEGPSDFWRRWHITLSAWFRDYVYIPLGGNRVSRPRLALNILVTWLLTGLWHGAGWNFLLWGAWWGCMLLIERFLIKGADNGAGRAAKRLWTWLAMLLGWVIFASEDGAALAAMLRGMLAPSALLGAEAAPWLLTMLPLAVICGLLCFPGPVNALRRLKAPARAILCAALILLGTAALAAQGYHPFIYFRF